MNDDALSPEKSTRLGLICSSPKIILFGILLLVILSAIFFICRVFFAKKDVLPMAGNQKNLISSSSDLEFYYYTVDDSSQKSDQYKIFKAFPGLDKSDAITHSFSIAGRYSSITIDSWKKKTILFLSNSETQAIIYSLDVSSENSQPKELLTIPLDGDKGEKVGSARFVDGGTAIAFIIAGGKGERAENSVLNIVQLQDKSKNEKYLLSEKSALYAGFHFMAATIDSRVIYLDETGGDGGVMWSKWYKIDRNNQKVEKMEKMPPITKLDTYPPRHFVFSPDRSKIAYADFSVFIEEKDLNSEGYWGGVFGDLCLKSSDSTMEKYESEGGVIMILDLQTGNTKEVFRNLSYPDNVCKNIARLIASLKWTGDSHIAFETIDGIYSLDLNTGQQKNLFAFEKTNSPWQQALPEILSVQLPFIVLSDQRIVRSDTNKELHFTTPEAKERHFFVFE